MSWTVLVTAPAMAIAGQEALQSLTRAGCECRLPDRPGPHTEADLFRLLPGCDAVLASVEPYTAALLASPTLTCLKLISRWGVGFDAVNLAAATESGVLVTNTPGLLDEAVADYTFALLLALARRIPDGQTILRAGEWKASWGWDVAGKTLGLVGCGRIARAVAQRAKGFNLRLLASDPTPDAEGRALGIEFVSLPTLLAQSDFVSLHAALTPGSRGLIGATELRAMKPTALLINAGRGALLDEKALAQALKENWIAGAALDVFCEEPLPADHPFRAAPNLLLTPHQASYAADTGKRVSETAAQAIIDALQGRRPRFVVNAPVCDLPQCRVAFHG